MDSQALASWGAVVVGAAGVAAAFYAALKASRSSQAGLAHAVKMSEHELRAYVFLKEITLETQPMAIGDPQSTGWLNYEYCNSGKTPAKNVRVAARAIWRQRGASIDEGDVGPFRAVGPLGPNDQLDDDLKIEGAPKPEHIRSMVESSGCEVHLIGCIKYSDEWSEGRETSFHYYIGADAGWDECMTAATMGNNYK